MNKKSFYTLALHEVTGSTIVVVLMYLSGLHNILLISSIPLAIPASILFELVANKVFIPIRKYSYYFELGKKPREKTDAANEMLLMINISRNYSLLFFVVTFFGFIQGSDTLALACFIGGPVISLTFFIAMVRYEKYFRAHIYDEKSVPKWTKR